MGAGGRPCLTFAGAAFDRVVNQDPNGWLTRGMGDGRPCPLLASGEGVGREGVGRVKRVELGKGGKVGTHK